MTRFIILTLVALLAGSSRQEAVDPGVRAAVERFYAAQEAEDAAAYFALWSRTAQRPRPEQLKYIFDSGDDKFSTITITRTTTVGDQLVVRVSVIRDRTSATTRRADGSPVVSHSAMTASLAYVKEDGDWKLVREGTPVDGLAFALLAAPTVEEREALLAAEPELAGPGLLSALSRQGDTFAQTGQYEKAQTVYERVAETARRTGNKKSEGEALQNVANAMYYQRNFTGALAVYEQRLAVEREAASDEGIASALLGVATIRYSLFEYTQALARYREALAIQERLPDESGVATTLISTGNVQFVQGDFDGAIADYRRSRDLYRKQVDPRGEARALEGLGRVLAAQGDFAAALESYAGVREEGRAGGDRTIQGSAVQHIGEIHFRLGNLDAARALFDESRTHFEAVHDSGSAGRVWQAAALTELVAGRFAPAEQGYLKSSAACTTVRDADCVARAIVGLAFALASQERYDSAIESYRKAIDAFNGLRKREDAARAEVGLSQALLGKKEAAAALAAAGHARQEGSALAEDDVVWRALVAEARALRTLGSAAKALAAATDAVAAVRRMSDAALERPGEVVPFDSEAAYSTLAVLQAEGGDARDAFTTIEQRRGHELRIALARNERDIARGMTTAERDDERVAAADVVTLRVQLDNQKALPKSDTASLERLQQRVTEAAARRTAQQQRVFARLPDLRAWRGLAPAITADDLAEILPTDDTVVAQFVMDDQDLLVVVARRAGDGIQFGAFLSPISRRALADRVSRAVSPAALRGVDEWLKASADLVAAIPADALTRIAAAPRAIIIPDDALWYVPFEALPVKAGFLADSTSVVYAGSITSLARAITPAGTAPAPWLLAIAAPELSTGLRDRAATTAPGWTLRAPEAADAEARRIASALPEPPAVLLTGASATESAFRAQAPGAAILHLGVPFRMNSASPLFSSALMAGSGPVGQSPLLSPGTVPPLPSPDDDGTLEAREVMNLDLRARVAVLSDGGAMPMRGGAGAARTVQWAWRVAGVPTVAIARWTADDGGATELLTEFYRRVKAGEAPEAALQGAGAALRGRADTRAPYFWAGWMLIGR